MTSKIKTSGSFKIIDSPYFLFAIFTALGFFFRMHIGQGVSMHTDEGQFAYVHGDQGIFGIFDYVANFTSRDQPIIMYLLTYFWKSFVGQTPAVLRLLPCLLSSLSIFASGYLCLKYTKDKFISILLSLLVALSPMSVRFSYDLTPYSLMSLVAPISFFLFMIQIRDRKWIPSFGLILTNMLFLNIHYYAFFVVAAQMAILLFYVFKTKAYSQLKEYALTCAIYFIVAALPLSFLFKPDLAQRAQTWIKMIHPPFWSEILLKTIGFYPPALIFYTIAFPIGFISYILFFYRKKNGIDSRFSNAFLYFASTLLIIFAVQLCTWPFLGGFRYLMILFPVLFFILAIIISSIRHKISRYVVAAVFCMVFATDVIRGQPHINQDFEGAFAYLHEKQKEEPFMLLFLPPNYNKPLSYYYSALFRLKNTIVLQNQFLMPGHEVERSDFVRFMREKNITKAYFLHYYLFESGQVRDFYLHRLGLIFNVKRDKDFKDINLYEMDLRADAK